MMTQPTSMRRVAMTIGIPTPPDNPAKQANQTNLYWMNIGFDGMHT